MDQGVSRAGEDEPEVDAMTPEEAADALTRESERLGLYDQEDDVTYHIPPADFRSISDDGCGQCGAIIGYFPVIGGHKWCHITRPADDHEVVIPRPWWDTHIGEYRTDVFVPDGRLQEPAHGMTPRA